MSVDAALAVFERNHAAYLESLQRFLRFESISAQSTHADDMAGCADWISRRLSDAGLTVRVVPTARHPVVIADTGPLPDSNATTLLFYGHYDVQPVGDLKLWQSPPFEPTIRDGAIYARGSADDKGQLMTHLAAVACWKETGAPWPCRIKFVIEGEEEIGSPSLPDVLRQHAADLACDYVVLSDTSKLNEQIPALAYATRGLVYKELVIDGPSHDLHSGQYGGAVANPANVLARILAALQDDSGRVTISEFYDDVRPLSDWEKVHLNQAGFTDSQLLAGTGSPAPAGEPGFTSAERCTARPTFDVNGLIGGYTGEGAATVIPTRATAKVSMRLVADQDPDKISRAFDRAVQALCPPSVRLTIGNHTHCAAYQAPTDSPGMKAAAAALTAAFGRTPVYTREGGSLPILPLFKKILGADSLMLGFCVPDCNLHSPNEFFHVADFHRGTQCILRFLSEMAQKP